MLQVLLVVQLTIGAFITNLLLSAGIYLVMIHSEEGKGIKKIIKN